MVVTLAASLFGFIACNKYAATSNPTSTGNNIPSEVTVTASLQGRVVDENGLPVQGAAVTSGTASTTTDINGVFTFKNITLSSRFGFVRAAKTGYFTGSRSIITNGGASNFISIQLIPRTATGTFQAANGGTVRIATGDSAAFPAASVVNAATNAPYTGTVHVYAAYLDPTDPNLYKYMPGDLRGIGSDGKETALQTFGMLAVELEDDAGNKLQITSGQKATLTWAIPASLQSTAPATIPLWYFNDSTGRWIQQGTATRQGNNYVGQVSHFSFWNCDAPAGTVNFKVKLKDQYGNPLPYTLVKMVSATWWGSAPGYSDSAGFVQGLIPKGQGLTMQVMSECGNILAGVNVGPALTDQDLGTIVVTKNFSELTLTGKVVDCYGNAIDSGFVNAVVDGLTYRGLVLKGAFILPINRCFNTTISVKLTALNYATAQSGSAGISAAFGTVDAGTITTCGTVIDQYVSFTIGGTTYNIVSPPDGISYTYNSYLNKNNIYASTSGTGTPSCNFRMPPFTGTGNYPVDSAYFYTPKGGYVGSGLTCNVTTYGAIGQYIIGSFTGSIMLWQNGSPTQSVSGTFKLKRTL